MEYPPSMAIVCPLMNLASGPQRKETTPVTSEYCAIWPVAAAIGFSLFTPTHFNNYENGD